jgi:hypothetical protein
MLLRERNAELTGISATREKGSDLLAEMSVLYPQVSELSYARTLHYDKERAIPDTLALVMVTTKGKDLTGKEKELVEKWLTTRLKSGTVKVIFNK